jgi:hypothetical protein
LSMSVIALKGTSQNGSKREALAGYCRIHVD